MYHNQYAMTFVSSALFYYVLGNLQPKLRSKLQSIQLIAVVTSPTLKEYGFAAILKPFICDVNKLSQVRYHSNVERLDRKRETERGCGGGGGLKPLTVYCDNN